MTEHDEFVNSNIARMESSDEYFQENLKYHEFVHKFNYQYNFSWMGRPVIQLPTDIYALHEIVWNTQPDLIIETGIAHGGSLVLSASMLAQLDYIDALKEPRQAPSNTQISNIKKRHVVGIDIEIRQHNKTALEEHALRSYFTMIEGSSTDSSVVQQVKQIASNYERVMVVLDSNHTHSHVLAELNSYAELVSVDCYLVVWDSGLENLSASASQEAAKGRPWGLGNNPHTATVEFLEFCKNKTISFEPDRSIRTKIGISAASNTILKRVS